MRKILLASAWLMLSTALATAQNPAYMLYDRSCMDQLEYRNAATGATVYVYALNRQPNINLFFTLSTQVIYPPGLPEGYTKCEQADWNDAVIDAVNSGKQQSYLVFQTASGFSMYAIQKVMRVQRSGGRYEVKSEQYHFAIDTSRLFLETNLAFAGSSHYVFYTGFRQQSCLRQYTFLLEPIRSGARRTELAIIPTIGVVYERSGNTPEESDQNQYRLQSVNTVFLDEYITRSCPYNYAQTYRTVPTGTPTVNYGIRDGAGIYEPNKEDYSSRTKWGTGGQQGGAGVTTGRPYPTSAPTYPSALQGPALINCPTPPGLGYHIVQPGEHLNAIARSYGVPSSKIIQWNKLKNPNKIYVCQKLFMMDPATIPVSGPKQSKGLAAATMPTVVKQTPYWITEDGRTWEQVKQSEPPPPGMTRIHVVQLGENLGAIANTYSIPEADLRRFNKLPATGNAIIYPGQTLHLSDQPTTQQASAPAKTIDYNAPADDGRAADRSVAQPATSPRTFQEMSVTKPVSATTPDYNTPATEAAPAPATPSSSYPPAAAYREHVVKQGETLQAVAQQYNASAEEIAYINGISTNEVLIAGKRLQVPIR